MTPALAQGIQPRCLHGGRETEVQAERRVEALDASDLVIRVLDRNPRGTAYPSWEALAKSPRIASLRGMAGRPGDLARKMQWGGDQPLPGWRIHYVAAQDGYAFSLTDIRDPCQFTLASNDTGMVIEGTPADRRGQVRTIPLDSTH
jgi:hypothetical protein